MQCTQCHATMQPAQKFCPACGAPAPEQPTSSNNSSLTTVRTLLTTNRTDFWAGGSLALLAISLFLPALTGPSHLSIAAIQLGFFAWLGFLVLLAALIVTVVPSFRPQWWTPVNRWFSAATVGSTVAISILILSLSSLLNHAINQFVGSVGAFSSFLGGYTNTLHLSLGIGTIFALIGSLAWTITAWRSSSPASDISQPAAIPPLPTAP